MSGERGKQTEIAVQEYLHALGQGVDKVIDGYSEDATILTPEGSIQGLKSIRNYYELFTQDTLPLLAASYALSRFDVVGEAAYLIWSAAPSIPMGTDTFLIHKGKIVLHTTSMYMLK